MSTTSDTEGQTLNLTATVRGFAGGQRVLNRYTLQRILGQGGMGIVWLAHDDELEREVALKFLPDIVINDRASLNDLKKETRRSLELTHPNIVRTYDFVQDSMIAGISMEYVDCDTLRNLRVDQPGGVFQAAQLGEWTRQLCSALDYAHMNAAIVHRDLKPANLMVNARNQLKIADFGIARSLVESISLMTLRGGVSGTLVYMSPQQLSGDSASPADDIYATGATLYDLLTSRPPFYTGDITGQIRGKAPATIAERRASLGIPTGDIPENWERTIAACLAKDPAARPHSAGEIAVNLGLVEAASITRREFIPAPSTRAIATTPGAPGPQSASFIASTAPPPTVPPTSAGGTATIPPPPAPAAPPRKRIPTWVIAAAPALAVLILAALYTSTAGNRTTAPAPPTAVAAPATTPIPAPAPAAPTPPQQGGLLVTTDPPGATVTVGNLPPKTSPAAFSDLPVGDETVQISMNGYETAATTATIAAGKIDELAMITLERSKGPLAITSIPPGLPYVVKFLANPLLSTSGSTPMDASEMPSGDYQVTVTRDGWPAQEKTVTVSKGQQANAAFDFSGGIITINSTPAGATVQAEGKPIGITPLNLTDVRPGHVTYSLQLAGYSTTTVDGTSAPGASLLLAAELKKAVTHHIRHHSSDDDDDNNDSGHESIGERVKQGFMNHFGW